MFPRLRSVWRNLVHRRAADRELEEELSGAHAELTDDYVRQGMTADAARRAATLTLGHTHAVSERIRDARAGAPIDSLLQDVRYGIRTLARDPGFAAVAILSLAVGIGANTAVFSIVNGVLLRPRAVAHPEELVQLYTGERHQPYDTCSYPSYVDFRDRNGVFSGLAAYGSWQFRLGGAKQVELVWGEVVSGNYFDVLGVRAGHGRTFIPEEDATPGTHPVAVLSHQRWQRQFNADTNLIGQTITINGQKLTVVGIAPPQYTGMMGGIAIDVWVPVMTLPLLEPARSVARLSRSSRWLELVGRLKQGVTLEQARARFEVLSREMQAAYPEEWRSNASPGSALVVNGAAVMFRELFVTVLPERDTRIDPEARPFVYAAVGLVMVIVNLVMAIACMNLTGMLLARSVVRRRELAVRLALGAGRFRIVRQLVSESLLLSFLAAALGTVASVWLLDVLLANMPALPEGLRLALDIRLDWRVVIYTMGVATVTGVLFGLFPAWQGARTDVSPVLKNDSSAFAIRKSRLRSVLVVIQVALALLLLVGAGLAVRSLEKVRPTRLGFESENVVVAAVNMDPARYDRARSQAFYRALSERLSSMPGVQAVSLVDNMPGDFLSRSRRGTEIEGYQSGTDEPLSIESAFVGPRYFTNMKTPIVAGRDFDERDREGSACVAIVNEAFRQRYFATAGSPLGKHLTKFEPGRKVPCEIVGVVRDERWQSHQREVRPFYWMALLQTHRTRLSALVHMAGDPASGIGGIRRVLNELDPNMPANDIQTIGDSFAATAYPFRLLGLLLAGCGVVALLLATIGVYGLVAYSVAQRKREMGIRMALGAVRKEILTLVVSQGMALVAWGLVLGLGLSFALTRVLTTSLFAKELLFGVSAADSLTFAGVTMLLALVALAACAVPALRATRVDPVVVLRYE